MFSVFFTRRRAMRLRIFVDYWNFQLNWNHRSNGSYCDWTRFAPILFQTAQAKLQSAGLGQMTLEETRVYASYESGRENKLRGWLTDFLDRQPGVRVFQSERHWRQKSIHCRSCNNSFEKCPNCSAFFGRASEKAIDSLIVTDLINLAWENAYDVALLVSSDRDFILAIDTLQRKNFKVVNATWQGHGHELSRVCWASLSLDGLIPTLIRQPT